MDDQGSENNRGGEALLGPLTALEERLSKAQSRLSRSRRELLQAILEDAAETCFLSSPELAKRYNVDAATVVRTIQALGHDRFADFTADLRQHFMTRLTPYTIMSNEAKAERSLEDRIQFSLERDAGNLHALRTSVDVDRVVELARQIHSAKRILIVGVDQAAALSYFFAYTLRVIGLAAESPVGSAGYLQHSISGLTENDLVIAISFGRSLKATVETVLQARRRRVPTFGITDSDTTPIARHCDAYLVASITSSAFSGSYVVPMALLNGVLIACSHFNAERSLDVLRRAEKEYRSGSRWYSEPTAEAKTKSGTKRAVSKGKDSTIRARPKKTRSE